MTTLHICLIMIASTILVSCIIMMILKNKTKNISAIKQKTTLTGAGVKLITSYFSPAEMHFLECIYKSLPKDFIAFPYVSLEKLLLPTNSKVDFNIASSKIIDVCIFLQSTMEPVLAIDLYSPSPLNNSLKKIDQDVIQLLKNAGLPFIQIRLEDDYNLTILKNDLLNAMKDKTIAKLKK
ncbi:MAG: DUF2726 domain-containing protein [Clostridiales bacterium]|nr:DUF2726 domain-containing protein [Clostridiales bacterium]